MKVIVGLSGGVDSSVAALLLMQAGYEVEGLFMKNWEEDDSEECSVATDLRDATHVANTLGIVLHTVNFSAEYWQEVWSNFIAEHKRGRTPNPDVLCNQRIKFAVFLDYALSLGADKIATGHYADIQHVNDTYILKRAKDEQKDQTYFLYLLNQYQLSKSLFPLAQLYKQEVRNIATVHGFTTADKKDSTGICFIGERNFRSFLSDYITPKEGSIIDEHGQTIGTHMGAMFYTIGQRKGLGIGGGYGDGSNAPWFVADKDIEANTVTVVQGEHPLLFHTQIITEAFHAISTSLTYTTSYLARIRHRGELYPCKITPLDDESKGVCITFAKGVRAITPGQSVVIYDEYECIGGAIIKERY